MWLILHCSWCLIYPAQTARKLSSTNSLCLSLASRFIHMGWCSVITQSWRVVNISRQAYGMVWQPVRTWKHLHPLCAGNLSLARNRPQISPEEGLWEDPRHEGPSSQLCLPSLFWTLETCICQAAKLWRRKFRRNFKKHGSSFMGAQQTSTYKYLTQNVILPFHKSCEEKETV